MYHPDLGRFAERDPNPEGEYAAGMNFYEFVNGKVIVSNDPSGLKRLSTRICERYLWGDITFSDVVFGDDENEMPGITSDYVEEFYINWLKEKRLNGEIKDEWSKISIVQPINAVQYTANKIFIAKSYKALDTGWWLNASAKVMVSGSIEAKCSGPNHVITRNRVMQWSWFDEIDANSFTEAYKKNDLSGIWNKFHYIVEGATDIIYDKVLNFDYGVEIQWSDWKQADEKFIVIDGEK